jgi:hypothetical protein
MRLTEKPICNVLSTYTWRLVLGPKVTVVRRWKTSIILASSGASRKLSGLSKDPKTGSGAGGERISRGVRVSWKFAGVDSLRSEYPVPYGQGTPYDVHRLQDGLVSSHCGLC